MVGSGIFALPSAFGRATGGLGALIAWTIAGIGMPMLAFVFQTLSRRRPDLDTGIYAYAKAGFGDYPGFASAVGYWIGCCLADVACLVLIKATLDSSFQSLAMGRPPFAIAAASALLWGVHLLILRGIKEAAALNTIATFAKIVPILLFIVVVIFAFKTDFFAQNFWGGDEPTFANVSNQVRNTMLVTVFVFVGIEGASVYSRYAKRPGRRGDRNDFGFSWSARSARPRHDAVVWHSAASGTEGARYPFDGRRIGDHRGTVGQDLHQRWPSHFRPW
jgi:arginine:ornithine antiporter/lysine permease